MLSLKPLLLLLTAATIQALTLFDFNEKLPRFQKRDYIAPNQRLSSYDFVIAGGGLSGLVLAARLSDDSNHTVLVLEAGPSGDDVASRINIPSEAYFNSLVNVPSYDWSYTTTPQANASRRALNQPRGRVLGGSTAINGMYYVHPSKEEVNAWHDLIAPSNTSAAAVWSWDSFFTTLKGTETFTPPSASIQSAAGIEYNNSSRGNAGRLRTTYPGYLPPIATHWLPSLQAAGIPSNPDPYAGYNIGGFIATSTINPSNWTRSYSKSAYIDILPPRSNLHIMSGATVERVVFASNNDQYGNKIVTSLEFSTGKDTEKQSVSVAKEAILCGGAFGSPQILQLSGVGPRDVLEAANVTVQLELPGVGQHLMDHLTVPVYFNTSEDTAGSIYASGSDLSKSPAFNSYVNDAIAYINGSRLLDGDASFATLRSQIAWEFDNPSTSRVPSTSAEVIEGYKAIYQATLEKIYPTAGIIEFLFSINSVGQVAIQSALQQSLSQGRTYITSPSVYDYPSIDPQYLSHPADIVILRQALKLARVVAATPPLSSVLTAETLPGSQIQSDGDIETYIRNAVTSEFHPCGTCAMMPREKGGVVDARFKVYSVQNLRVVDSSVFPISFSAHLMSPTYAMVEKAAELILEDWNGRTEAGATPTNKSSANIYKGNLLWAWLVVILVGALL